jgi:hypothetical protein
LVCLKPDSGSARQHRRHPEVLAVLHGEPRRMGHKRPRRSFETPRKRAAPQDDGMYMPTIVIARSVATKQSSLPCSSGLLRFARNDVNIHICSG